MEVRKPHVPKLHVTEQCKRDEKEIAGGLNRLSEEEDGRRCIMLLREEGEREILSVDSERRSVITWPSRLAAS